MDLLYDVNETHFTFTKEIYVDLISRKKKVNNDIMIKYIKKLSTRVMYYVVNNEPSVQGR